MGQKIRLNEAQLKRIIAESVKKVLAENINEISPEFYKEKADSAREKLGKFPAKLRGFIDPEWKKEKEDQLSMLDDFSEDHPDDEWEFDHEAWSSPNHDTAYMGKNKRTGENRCIYNDASDNSLRVRGKVVSSGDSGKQGTARYLDSLPKRDK